MPLPIAAIIAAVTSGLGLAMGGVSTGVGMNQQQKMMDQQKAMGSKPMLPGATGVNTISPTRKKPVSI